MRISSTRSTRPYIERLRHFTPLAGASFGELRAVAQVADVVRVRAGCVVADDRWHGHVVVGAGAVLVVSPDGVSLARPGACVITGSGTLVAATDADVVLIARRAWSALRAMAPGVVAALDAAASSEAVHDGAGHDGGEQCSAGAMGARRVRGGEERGRVPERT